jgi:hypothetical protein
VLVSVASVVAEVSDELLLELLELLELLPQPARREAISVTAISKETNFFIDPFLFSCFIQESCDYLHIITQFLSFCKTFF